ncbi:alpha/beta hydrolase [Spirosoma sordidisoli]|uniref:Alpha/beta hydrolase n=1 Tax=Spirosoma sordidisoli TaxID=2502893 RepID=A0A4V1RVJ9_9BACT|nr:alpha/beta hydrolase [Spirosoma sordidisoli]RYC67028.1 alpha/beta hydrolase [Spirosoma sordidisoli]
MPHATRIQFFDVQDTRIAFRVFGSGPAVLLAFHGFGQSSVVFEHLQRAIGSRFTVFAIDLFLHGQSLHTGNPLLTKTSWQRLLDAFLETHGIERFSLMGFSLGGRFALATTEAFASRVDELLLIAPDGITRSFWYQLATSTRAGRALFRYMLHHLPILTDVGHTLVQLGLLNRTAMRFAELSLSTPAQRDLVYRSWTQFRLISPRIPAIAQLLNTHPVRVRLFAGAFDRIVPGRYLLPLTDRLHRFELTVFRTGHNHLIELTAERV